VTHKRLSLLLGKVDRLNLKGAVLRRPSDLVVAALGSSPSWYHLASPRRGQPPPPTDTNESPRVTLSDHACKKAWSLFSLNGESDANTRRG
jgi:hypothetical protein